MLMNVLYINGLKGQRALSLGQRPGYRTRPTIARKGKSMMAIVRLMPLQGDLILNLTQGFALGCNLIGLLGRLSSKLRNLNTIILKIRL